MTGEGRVDGPKGVFRKGAIGHNADGYLMRAPLDDLVLPHPANRLYRASERIGREEVSARETEIVDAPAHDREHQGKAPSAWAVALNGLARVADLVTE